MANFILSTNMQLPVPVVGIDPGPDWASNINSSLTLLDQHDHSSGKGVPVTPAGMNISSDLPFGGNNATLLKSVRYSVQSAVLGTAADLGCTYVVGKDLYYNDGNGNQVRITQNGGIAGSPGSISNLVSPASAAYNSGTGTFIFQQAANTAANIDGAAVVLRNATAGSNGVTLSPPAAIASNYTLALPTVPATQSIVTIDSSGNFGTPVAYPIPQAGLAANSVGASQVIAASIDNTKLAAPNLFHSEVNPSTFTRQTITSQAAISGASGSITGTGKPITVTLQALAGASFPSYFEVQSSGSLNAQGFQLFLYKGGSQILEWDLNLLNLGNNSSSDIQYPINFQFTDIGTVGTLSGSQTYAFYMSPLGANVKVGSFQFIIREL